MQGISTDRVRGFLSWEDPTRDFNRVRGILARGGYVISYVVLREYSNYRKMGTGVLIFM
jgi:hypothetical protein